MFTILLHSSKTTRQPIASPSHKQQLPALLSRATVLANYLKSLSSKQLQTVMKISETMADKTYVLVQDWREDKPTLPAIDLFLGDIYSGLQVQSFTQDDRHYANDCLFILSGLYGAVRALDCIQPYRLEMGYRLPGNAHDPGQPPIMNLYNFWGDTIAELLPKNKIVINLSAVEYTKAVLPHLHGVKVIAPKFLTVNLKTNEPTFVTVHTKIARGAFARWLIQERIEDEEKLQSFKDLGYAYDASLSTETEPVFIAKEFKGIGLSVRLT